MILIPMFGRAIVKLCPDIEHKRFAFNHHADEFCNWLIAGGKL